ncbi:DNA (cytosine-5-)-methyltransferase [Microcoleus sp. FACHB-68]|uniref:DNA cytosine methyltransferase n=1 Tax=Microcoleus sp. FACHB-68 TaxID=2692826 RepID=UPI0016881C44|nr:DNA (cytosine-5-)-methyltransferase [Microcoleus sp. FACHB-68]MBD1939200.1 DNA (cytosine-5-)-methyltransferase [Microcoleus sp. FACHB-68]
MKLKTLQSATDENLLKFAEFFAGIGLVRKGLERAGWQCVLANDNDQVKGEIYSKNFGNDHLLIDNIANLYASNVPDVSLVTASFPCQDLSLAGNRQGLAGNRSGTFFEFMRILKELATNKRLPPVVLIENVPGLLTSSKGQDIRNILVSLNQLSYSCDVLVVDAVHFLPQSRPRVFIIGMNLGKVGNLTEVTKENSRAFQHPCRPMSVQKVFFSNPDISWGFLNLSPLPAIRESIIGDLVDTRNHQEWFRETQLLRELSYIRCNSKKRLETARQVARSSGQTVYLSAYRRMRKGLVCLETRDDGIAGCLRTGSGGSSRQILIVVLPDQVKMRYMTAREYGRLQGVEDSFWIPESQSVGRYAFGDAVAVPVITWIGKEIKRYLVVNSQRPIFLNEITEVAVVNV